MRGLLLSATLVLAGCSHRPPEDLQTLYQKAQANFEAGETIRASDGAERGRALSIQRHDELMEWRFRLLQADILVFARRPEPVLAVLDVRMPERPEFAAMAARRTMFQACAYAILHRGQEADDFLERARQAAERARAPEVVAEVQMMQGIRLIGQQRYTEGLAVLTSARRLAQSVGSAYQEAGILLNIGMNSLRQNRYDDAANYFLETSQVATPARSMLYALSRQNLAICYKNLGELDRAIAIEQEAVVRQEKSGNKPYLALALGELGRTYLLKGDLRRAAASMDRALTLSLETDDTIDAAVWASNLSGVYLELGDLANAETLNQESIRLRRTLKSPVLFYNELNAANIARARRDFADAARKYEQAMKDGSTESSVVWECQEGLGAIALAEGRLPEAASHLEAAVSKVERVRSSLDSAEFKLPFLTRLIRLYSLYLETLLQQGQIERALAVADSSRAQVLAERSGAAPVRRLPAGAYGELARSTGAVLLSYWLGPERSHAWVVTGREIHHVDLPPAREIEPLVAAYQDAVERSLADPARIHLPAGERLFAAVVEPVLQWIPPGAHVIVTPDGALHGLNLESLPVPSPNGEPHYWIEDATISIAPSLALLHQEQAKAAGSAKRLLLIGDPVGVDKAYPPLAYAAGEIAAITQRFGPGRSVVISRENATPGAWSAANPGEFRAIHFTAHATANRESPLDSAVLLAGGKLYARDVMATSLTADLVTVSACRGAGIRLYSGEGLVGFSWAFLHAGARNVIAGLWDVNDQSTSKLMDALYREIAAGKDAATALHTAKLELVRTNGNLRKPYYWAPFQHYTVAP